MFRIRRVSDEALPLGREHLGQSPPILRSRSPLAKEEAIVPGFADVLRDTGPGLFFPEVSPGLDTAKGDPTGTWPLLAKDFSDIGRMIGSLRLPTLVVQEGGYNTRNLGRNARSFFAGLHQGYFPPAVRESPPTSASREGGRPRTDR